MRSPLSFSELKFAISFQQNSNAAARRSWSLNFGLYFLFVHDALKSDGSDHLLVVGYQSGEEAGSVRPLHLRNRRSGSPCRRLGGRVFDGAFPY